MSISIEIPMPLPSAANMREHHMVKARRVKQQRSIVLMSLRSHPRAKAPCTVRLTRIAPRPLDGDNLQTALKACRDGVADYLGVDDGSDAVVWRYAQERGAPKYQAIRVEVIA